MKLLSLAVSFLFLTTMNPSFALSPDKAVRYVEENALITSRLTDLPISGGLLSVLFLLLGALALLPPIALKRGKVPLAMGGMVLLTAMAVLFLNSLETSAAINQKLCTENMRNLSRDLEMRAANMGKSAHLYLTQCQYKGKDQKFEPQDLMMMGRLDMKFSTPCHSGGQTLISLTDDAFKVSCSVHGEKGKLTEPEFLPENKRLMVILRTGRGAMIMIWLGFLMACHFVRRAQKSGAGRF